MTVTLTGTSKAGNGQRAELYGRLTGLWRAKKPTPHFFVPHQGDDDGLPGLKFSASSQTFYRCTDFVVCSKFFAEENCKIWPVFYVKLPA